MPSVANLLKLFVMRIHAHKLSWANEDYLRHEKPQTNQALFVIHRTAEVTMLQTNFQQVTNSEFQLVTLLLIRETHRGGRPAKKN